MIHHQKGAPNILKTNHTKLIPKPILLSLIISHPIVIGIPTVSNLTLKSSRSTQICTNFRPNIVHGC